MKKFLVGILFVILALTLFSRAAFGQTLNFSQDAHTLHVGETHTLHIVLDPKAEEIGAVDVFLRFDPKLIEITEVSKSDVFTIMTNPLINTEEGQVKFSLLNRPGETVSENVEIAAISYVAWAESEKTALTFEFISGSTRDTNVVSFRGKDVLKSVGNAILTIQNETILLEPPPEIPATSGVETVVLPPHTGELFDIISPVPEEALTNPGIRVTESLDQSSVNGSSAKTFIALGAIFGLLFLIGLIRHFKKMFISETTSMFVKTS